LHNCCWYKLSSCFGTLASVGHMFSDLVPRLNFTSFLGLIGGAGAILLVMVLLVFVVRCRRRSSSRTDHGNFDPGSKRANLKLDEGSNKKNRCPGHNVLSSRSEPSSSPDKQPVISSRDSVCQQQSDDSSLLLESPSRGKLPIDQSLVSSFGDQGPGYFHVSDSQRQWGRGAYDQRG
jgi:hypothetical protein